MRARLIRVIPIGLLIFLAACNAGPNTQLNASDSNGIVSGFWRGLWHGIISPVTFFISLFADTVNIYEVHNNGNWYNFGFVIGAGILFGGGAFGAKKKRS